MKKIMTLLAALMLAACSDSDVASAPSKTKLQPEQVIQFKKAKFACSTKEAFEKASLHAYRKEETKFRAMFNGFDCLVIPKDVDFKVLSIIERRPEFDIIEITNAKNATAATGMFAEWDY